MAGETAAIALHAVHALALLGDPRVEGCVRKIAAINKPWFKRQIRTRLKQTLDTWKPTDPAQAEHPVGVLIRLQVESLV